MTPNQQMNTWMAQQLMLLEDMLHNTRDERIQSYLAGYIAGLKMLQGKWLREDFHKGKD